jgi:hypothetical protein
MDRRPSTRAKSASQLAIGSRDAIAKNLSGRYGLARRLQGQQDWQQNDSKQHAHEHDGREAVIDRDGSNVVHRGEAGAFQVGPEDDPKG